MTELRVSAKHAPAIGDVRALAAGDVLVIFADACLRQDWPRYMDAIGVAVTRGAAVQRAAKP